MDRSDSRHLGLGRVADEVRQDAVFGLRLLARSPAFSVIAVATLAGAIGANTAIFAVADALLTPLPVVDPPRLVRVHSGQSRTSWPNYEDIRDHGEVFLGVAAGRPLITGLAVRDVIARLTGEQTSVNYFDVLGVSAALGRTFTGTDLRRNLVVLADHTWRMRFGAEPMIVGRVVRMDGRSYEVAGVMPAGFRGVAPPGLRRDFWVPVDDLSEQSPLRDRGLPYVEVIARLRPGVQRVQAAAVMRTLALQLRAAYPVIPPSFLEAEVFPVDGVSAFRGLAGSFLPVFAFLGLMTVVSGLVLLIGCANVAGLLLGRAVARRREMATRLAVGARPGRLVRQLLVESLLLAFAGGSAGVVLAMWLTGGVNLLASRLPVPMAFDFELSGTVLVYALALSTLTSLVFGLAPARRAARLDIVVCLKTGGGDVGGQPLRRALVAGQIALCSILLVWSGLFVRSLGRVSEVNPGFDPRNVLLAHVALSDDPEARARGEQVFVELQQRVRGSHGVQAAGTSLVVPLSLTSNEEFYVNRENEAASRLKVVANRLSPGWFATVGIPLLAGRDFTWDDRSGTPGVVVVNETLARRFWDGDALGKQLQVPVPGNVLRTVEVIGIVGDSRYWTLGEAIAPAVYLPFRQAYLHDMTLHVRTADMSGTTHVIEQALRQLAPDIAADIRPMTQVVAVACCPPKSVRRSPFGLGCVAMLLATLGVYGLVSCNIAQRSHEMSIRKALGARTADILLLVVGGSVRTATAALAVGLAGGVLGAAALAAFIVDVSPMDPVTLMTVTLLIIGTAVAASALPAVSVARREPLAVLRDI